MLRTLGAYEHFFQAERHARIQEMIYQRLALATVEVMQEPGRPVLSIPGSLRGDAVVEDGWAMLLALGGAAGGSDATTTNES